MIKALSNPGERGINIVAGEGNLASTPVAGRQPASIGRIAARALDMLMRLVENFDAILLAAMTVVVCWEIFSRFFAKYINGINSPWTEEVAMVFMVWFGLTGAAIGIRRASHIGVEFVVALFPKRVGQAIVVLVDLIILGFSYFLLVEGYRFAKEMIGVLLTATEWSRGYVVYSAAPVTAILMLIYGLEALVKDVKALAHKEGEA